MSAFVPLNAEPAEEIEDVDDTKEIQIEEALKLYQNALKLHSQGPDYYDQADEAYKALFQSDIFKYPEAVSEYNRDQLWDFEYEDVYLPDENEGDAGPDTINTVSSALPQTIFLSYKNHAQFILDYLRRSLGRGEKLDNKELSRRITEALEDFAEALERDDTDAELWRKSSRVGDALKSHRIARFCLESVLDSDTHEAVGGVGHLGLEQTIAVRNLHRILDALQDRLSSAQIPLKQPKKSIARLFSKQADIYPYLPSYSTEVAMQRFDDKRHHYHTAKSASRTWTEVGAAIFKTLTDVDEPSGSLGPVRIQVLDSQNQDLPPSTLPILQRKNVHETTGGQSEDVHDTEAPDSDSRERITTHEGVPVSPKNVSEPNQDEFPAKDSEEQANEGANATERSDENKPSQIDENVSPKPLNVDTNPKTSTSQLRKRSSASAGNEEQMDGGRAKSRRIRARESIAEAQAHQEDVVFDQTKYFEDRLEHFVHADQWMFSTAGALLSKLDVEELGSIDELKHVMDHPDKDEVFVEKYPESVCMMDLRESIENWSGAQNFRDDIFTSHDGLTEVKQSGLSLFLERSRQNRQVQNQEKQDPDDEGLSPFLECVNSGHFYPQQVAFQWLGHHLISHLPTTNSGPPARFQPTSSYSTKHWPEKMRALVKDLVASNDEYMYRQMSARACDWRAISTPTATSEDTNSPSVGWGSYSSEMAQSIYEIHLDIYASISTPNTEVPESTRTVQQDRLHRWEALARTMINHDMQIENDSNRIASITLRHLWSTIMHLNITDEADREYVLACLEDLKQVLKRFDEPVITLVNNATMPELSMSAVEQELARISSMEFFMKVFGPGNEDPVSLIESIEPILDPSAIGDLPSESTDGSDGDPVDISTEIQHTRDLAFFIDRGDATLKLLLWRRLQKAYESIQYPTKVISCSLRAIEIIVGELNAATYRELPEDQRQVTLLRWLHRVDYLMLNVIGKFLDDPKGSFECIDMEHLQSSMAAVARLSKILHAFVLYEDSVRIGQTSPPEIRPASAAKAYEHYKEKLRSMLVRAWTLQYTLLKEGIEQNKDLFDMPSDDCINFLRSVHNALGIRSYCRYSKKLLLKVMKHELLTLDVEDSYESDIAQVLYDYYGLKFSPELGISQEHGCPIDRLDKPTALSMVDFAMLQANRMNIKDFLKSDLKSTMDTIHSAIGWSSRTYPALAQNKRIISTFLKSPINPSNLYRAVQGVSELSVVSVASAESYKVVEKGWYFLLGFAALMKFKTQKRLGPMTTDDLELAATFFRRELEHGISRWETWYRLAQVYDLRLEENITWTAEKLNTNRTDLALLERKAIHAYSMAVAMVIGTADTSAETKKAISELYTQFGFRIYASSREPFSMLAFSLDDFSRHYSNDKSQEMYKGPPFRGMKLYSAWHFAGYLFRKAMIDRPMNWINYYMFSKCLWKMYNSDDPLKTRYEPIEVDDILDSLDSAIEYLPKKKDTRFDPILEPHLKLTSIIHKLVQRGDLNPHDASKKLLATPWAKRLSPVMDMGSWKPFILDVLKNLRNADKSNWHHRVVLRTAHVIYDDDKDIEAAAAAKYELTQHIFTKTMTLQVWKPENERPGRHFVYTSRYVYFFVHILDQLNDRTSLDLLLRRVRRKPNDYVNYTKLWEDICTTYIKLFRRMGNVPPNYEEAVFKPITHDEFVTNAARLDTWSQTEKTDIATIDLVREAVELKKLNGVLIKAGMFEDLVGDAYARLYEKTVPRILKGIAEEGNRERMRLDHLLTGDGAEEARASPPPPAEKPLDKPSEKVPKTRIKGVTKKDVQRKADSIAAKAAASRPSAKSARLVDEDLKAPTMPSGTVEPADDKDGTTQEGHGPASKEPTEALEAPILPSSALPSAHGSGDEESELSEVDESKISGAEKPALPMFPNLLAKRLASPDPLSEASSNVSIDGGDADRNEHKDRDGDGDGDGDDEGDDGDDEEGDGDGDGDGDVGDVGDDDNEADDEDEADGDGDGEGGDDIEGNGGELVDVDDIGDDVGDEGEADGDEDGDEEGDEDEGESVPAHSFPDNKSDVDMDDA